MKSMEFVGPLLRFTEDADMGDVNLYESTVGGLADRDLVLSAPHKSKVGPVLQNHNLLQDVPPYLFFGEKIF